MTPDTPEYYIQAARKATRDGDYLEAYAQLGHLAQVHGWSDTAARLRHTVAETEAADLKDAARAPWAGFGVGLVGYLLISLRSPSDWTFPVWACLTMVLVPIIDGYYTAFYYGFRCSRAERFWPCAKAGGFAMVAYSIVGMMWAHSKIAEDAGPAIGGQMLAGFLAALVYGLAAAIVAGAAGAIRPYTDLPNDDDDEAWAI